MLKIIEGITTIIIFIIKWYNDKKTKAAFEQSTKDIIDAEAKKSDELRISELDDSLLLKPSDRPK